MTTRLSRHRRKSRNIEKIGSLFEEKSHEDKVLNECQIDLAHTVPDMSSDLKRRRNRRELLESVSQTRVDEGYRILERVSGGFGRIVLGSLPMDEDFKLQHEDAIVENSAEILKYLINEGVVSYSNLVKNKAPLVNKFFISLVEEEEDPAAELASDTIEDLVKEKVKRTIAVEKEISRQNRNTEKEMGEEEEEQEENDSDENTNSDDPDAGEGEVDDPTTEADGDDDDVDDGEDDDEDDEIDEVESDEDGEAADESSLAGMRSPSGMGGKRGQVLNSTVNGSKTLKEGRTIFRAIIGYNAKHESLQESGKLVGELAVAESLIQYTVLEALNTINLIDLSEKDSREMTKRLISESNKR